MRSFPLVLAATAFCFGSSFKTLVDRAGEWEAMWHGDGWKVVPVGSGEWSAEVRGVPQSEHPGDLDGPRLRALLALPANSAWNLEILGDSGRILAKKSWARIPRIDPRSGKTSPAPAANPPTSIEKVTGSVRMVSLDLPLTALESDGSLRVRTLLRVRMSWTGSVRPADGTPWKNIVDNPGGILSRIAGASGRRMGTNVANLGGEMLAIQVGDTAPFTTREDGVVRLTGAQIYQVTGASPGSVSWSNVALYGGTGDTVSTSNPGAPPAPGLRLLPLHRVDRNGDGVLDPNDEVWFWARGTSIWKADSTVPGGWTFSIHPYGETRRYFLRLDAPQGSPELGAPRIPSSPQSFATVWQPVWAGSPNQLLDIPWLPEDNTSRDASTGTGWFWWNGTTYPALAPSQLAYPSTTNLPGLSSDSGLVTVYTAAKCYLSSGYLGGMSFHVGSGAYAPTSQGRYTATFSVKGLSPTGNGYALPGANGFLVAGYTVTYPRDVSKLDSAAFPTPSLGEVSVPVGDTGTCWVLEHGSAVRTCSSKGGALRDSATDPDTWYAVFGSNPASRPVVLSLEAPPSQAHAIQDPTTAGSYDMVVVAPDAFLDLAEEYAAWRGNPVQIRPMKVGILRAQDVWDLWGSGTMDPAALRDALRWASSHWGISHALLFGGGHADPRHLAGPSDVVYLPQWESDQVATDDYYTWFDTTGAPIPNLALGRVPARSVAEARAWLDKVELFEDPTKATFGTWRNTMLFAADDEFHPDSVHFAAPDPNQFFSKNTESVSETMVQDRPWLQTEKLFEQTYPLSASNSKPEAKLALVNLLNQGAVGFNFFGHGAPYQMTDEDLMDIQTFQNSVVNSTCPFVFFAGSCSVGRDDEIDSRGLSEIFAVAAGKGSVAAVAGMRSTSSQGNTSLATTFWSALLDTTTVSPRTTGEALLRAKNLNGDDGNQDLYNLLGDPAIIPFPGLLKVSLDSVPDSLSALSKIALAGNAPGAGTVSLRLDHPLPADTFSGTDSEFVSPTPQQLFSLSTSVGAGKYSTSILLPAKIPFGDSAQFKAYAWNPTTRRDGGAVAAPRIMAGVGKDIPNVTAGPTLAIRSCDSSWTAGVAFGKLAQIPLPFCLEVDMRDSFGISSDQGPDEGVVFTLVGVKDPWHPDLHQGTDYHSAYAQLDLDSTLMQPGNTYTFQVSARDLMGNLSKATLQIQPQAHGQYELYEVFNSPNPVRDGGGTTFYFKLSSEIDTALGSEAVDTRIQSSIRIHTISGKLVRILQTDLSQKQPRPQATWDLRDSFGRPVANGLYPYAVTLRIPDATGTTTQDLVKRGIVAVAR